jgi:PREDICTED: similar to CG7102 CG7102-PA
MSSHILNQDKTYSGVSRLLSDLQKLAEDHETCDILFIVGEKEVQIYAHRIILRMR